MSKAYVIVHQTPTNPERMRAEYGSKVESTFEGFGGRFLVRGGEISYQEGESLGEKTVVVEFPDRDKALAWKNSEQYQSIRPGRTENSIGTFIIIDGVSQE